MGINLRFEFRPEWSLGFKIGNGHAELDSELCGF